MATPAYNVDNPQRVVVTPEIRQERQNFVRLEIVNKARTPVLFYWSLGREIDFKGTNNFRRLAADSSISYRVQLAFPYAVSDMVVLMAVDSNNRDRYLDLNSRRRIFVQPISDNSDVTRIIITDKSKILVLHPLVFCLCVIILSFHTTLIVSNNSFNKLVSI